MEASTAYSKRQDSDAENIKTCLSDSEENSAALARVNISNSSRTNNSIGQRSSPALIRTVSITWHLVTVYSSSLQHYAKEEVECISEKRIVTCRMVANTFSLNFLDAPSSRNRDMNFQKYKILCPY